MKTVITGGAGFIGSHLVDRLIEKGFEVYVLDNFSTGNRDNIKQHFKRKNFHFFKNDLSDISSIAYLLRKITKADFLFHLAALPRIGRSVDSPLETNMANVNGTLNALELAKKLGVKKFIYTSSSSVYGDQKTLPLKEGMRPNPKNPYACQKLIGEMYCEIYSKVYGLNILVFRLFNVYGKRMSADGAYKLVFTTWMEKIKNKKPLTVYGDGRQTRDFTYIDDVTDGLVLGMKKNLKNNFEIINLGSGTETSINKLAEYFKYKTVYLPARPNEEKYKVADIKKAKKLLGWTPKVNLQDGMKKLSPMC